VWQLLDQGIISTLRPIDDTDLANIFTATLEPSDPSRPLSVAITESQSPASAKPKPKPDSAIDGHLKRLAVQIGMIPGDNCDITGEEQALLGALDELNILDSRLKQLVALDAEEVEAESWNVDVLQQLIELSQKVGEIPFKQASDIYDLAPTGPASGEDERPFAAGPDSGHHMLDLAGPSPAASSKGKGRAQDLQVKRSIFNLHPRDAEVTWWSSSREEYGTFPSNQMFSSKPSSR
jgi:hypothetical protein